MSKQRGFNKLSFIASILSVGMLGCSGSDVPDTNGGAAPPATAATATDPAPIQLESIAFADLSAKMKEHEGKVIILDLWATW